MKNLLSTAKHYFVYSLLLFTLLFLSFAATAQDVETETETETSVACPVPIFEIVEFAGNVLIGNFEASAGGLETITVEVFVNDEIVGTYTVNPNETFEVVFPTTPTEADEITVCAVGHCAGELGSSGSSCTILWVNGPVATVEVVYGMVTKINDIAARGQYDAHKSCDLVESANDIINNNGNSNIGNWYKGRKYYMKSFEYCIEADMQTNASKTRGAPDTKAVINCITSNSFVTPEHIPTICKTDKRPGSTNGK